ncbi:MAG: hypothetical protein ACREND_07620 [Gemmatimonadaceae bacterium]
MSDEPQDGADTPPAEERRGVTIVILSAVLVALSVFFVRRAL